MKKKNKDKPNPFKFNELISNLLTYKSWIYIVLGTQILLLLFELIIPFIAKALVDNGITTGDRNTILILLVAQFFILVLVQLVELLKIWFLRNIGVRTNKRLLGEFMANILKQQLSFFYKVKEGDLIQMVTDTIRIEKFLTESFSNFIEIISRVFLYGLILFILSPQLSLIYIISVVLSVFKDILFLKKRTIHEKLRFSIFGKVKSFFIDTMRGIGDIKAFGLTEKFEIDWDNTQFISAKARLNILKLVQQYKGATKFLNESRNLIIIFLSAVFVVDGKLSLGGFVAIQYVLQQLDKQSFAIMEFINEYHDAKMSLTNMQDLHFQENEAKQIVGEDLSNFELNLNHIGFKYDDTVILDDFNLKIKAGMKIALVGESGSGKSTLLKIIMGVLNPSEGNIKLNNSQLFNLLKSWKENYSIVLQDGHIFRENLQYNITLDKSELPNNSFDDVLEQSCLSDFLENKPELWDMENIQNQTSKGQAQRILIARALYKEANVLIMDEATSALDGITEMKIFKSLFERYSEKTIIYTTHNLNLTQFADYIVMIENGEIIEQGTYTDLLEAEGTFFKYKNSRDYLV